MDFRFSDEQRQFQAALRALLEKQCCPVAVREAWASADGRVPGLWAELAAMGVVGLVGEPGPDEVDLVLVLEECGRAGRIQLARFRDLLGVSRRPAQLLLERFDADGLTRRVGDERVLRRAARG